VVAKQELSKRDEYEKLIFEDTKNIQNKLDTLLEHMLTGAISESAYKRKASQLQEELDKRKLHGSSINERSKNWYELVGKTMKVMNEQADALGSDRIIRQRELINAIGYN